MTASSILSMRMMPDCLHARVGGCGRPPCPRAPGLDDHHRLHPGGPLGRLEEGLPVLDSLDVKENDLRVRILSKVLEVVRPADVGAIAGGNDLGRAEAELGQPLRQHG